MLSSDSDLIVLLMLALPYLYVAVRVASLAYFHAKLRYHRTIVTSIKEQTGA
jgi:hypothetical protein